MTVGGNRRHDPLHTPVNRFARLNGYAGDLFSLARCSQPPELRYRLFLKSPTVNSPPQPRTFTYYIILYIYYYVYNNACFTILYIFIMFVTGFMAQTIRARPTASLYYILLLLLFELNTSFTVATTDEEWRYNIISLVRSGSELAKGFEGTRIFPYPIWREGGIN